MTHRQAIPPRRMSHAITDLALELDGRLWDDVSARWDAVLVYVNELEETVNDLHGSIGITEWNDLDDATKDVCGRVHTLLDHPEVPL